MMDMNDMLKIIVEREGSDLHLSVGKSAVMRNSGILEVIDPDILTPDDTERLMREITPPRYQQMLQEHGSADFAYAYSEQARFRVAVLKARGSIGIVMRLIPSKLLPFEVLGLPKASIIELLHAHRGMCIITGPTGSGKTTTLATMIDYINQNRYAHIITVEDPIEYTHPHKKSLVTQREVHVDTPSFSYALRGALRQDPDVILVGEIRDADTAEMAFRAAMTGHQVFSTLHTNSALGAIPRLLDIGVLPDIMAGNIIGVIAQRLVRKLCPHCRKAYPASKEEIRLLGAEQARQTPILYRPSGCQQCDYQGYRGRIAIMEILRMDSDLDDLVVRRATHREIRNMALEKGFRTLAQDGLRRVLEGVTALGEVARVIDLTDHI